MHNSTMLLLASILFALASSAAAQTTPNGIAPINRGPVPAWATVSEPLAVPPDASGLAFVRAQDTLVHLDASGQQTFVGQRIKLLHPQALQIGNVAVSWNPAVGSPVFHTLRIVRDGETTDLLDPAKFEVIRREDQLEQATLTGVLTAIFKVADLRVGDELEWAYTVPSGDPTLKATNSGMVALVGSILPGRYRIGLTWEAGQEPRIKATDDFGAPLLRTANAIGATIDNPAALVPPKDAPPRYSWQRIVEYSDFASWPAVSARFAQLFAEARKPAAGSPLRAEAARIAARHADPLERAQAALALVQDQVRYVYVGLDGGNYRPAAADETWQRRYGDCKGKTAMLLALLDGLGIAAEPVLVSNGTSDDGYADRLPSPGLFDHVLVRAQIGGEDYWLDGTLPSVAPGSTEPAFPYSRVLPLTQAGSDLVSLPWSPAKRPLTVSLYDIDIRDGIDEPARITTTTITRGGPGLALHVQMSAATPDQLLQAFRAKLTGSSQWNSIDNVSYRYDRDAQAAILRIAGTGPLDWDKDGDGKRSMSLPGGGFSPPGRRQRAGDQDQSVPFYDSPDFTCNVTTINLPVPVDPGKWNVNSTFDTLMYGRTYYRTFAYRDGTVRMVRASRTERQEIDPATAVRDNARLERFDNSMAWLYYDPKGKQVQPLPKVDPVDWADDWTGDAQACLPKDLRD